jgi:hypothetical protein
VGLDWIGQQLQDFEDASRLSGNHASNDKVSKYALARGKTDVMVGSIHIGVSLRYPGIPHEDLGKKWPLSNLKILAQGDPRESKA